MWNLAGKKIARLGSQLMRQASNFADDLGESLYEAKKTLLNDRQDREQARSVRRSLKIAILGLPNSGKSTLINHLIGRPVCAASMKIHTTRRKTDAIFCIDDTQLIFIDTPGMVGQGEINKYKLENTFKQDQKKSMNEANVVGIIQDMTTMHARERIHYKIIDLLKLTNSDTSTILILNKVDKVKRKQVLLDVVNTLTSEKYWPHFNDVFMISALTGDGVDDLRNYFIDSAKVGDWQYNENEISDKSNKDIIQELVKAKLLDNLPQELPYTVNVEIEHMHCYSDNSLDIVTLALCPSTRIARLLIGYDGQRIKKIALEAEQDLCKLFKTSVKLRVSVPILESNEKKIMDCKFT